MGLPYIAPGQTLQGLASPDLSDLYHKAAIIVITLVRLTSVKWDVDVKALYTEMSVRCLLKHYRGQPLCRVKTLPGKETYITKEAASRNKGAE